MARAREILGVRQEWLGFVDSGYPEGDPLPPLPEGCFGLVPVEVGAEALVRKVRAFRPHVMTTYNEEGGYPHPDHVMCHNISLAAFDRPPIPRRSPKRATRGSRSSSTTTSASASSASRPSTRR